MQSESNDDNGIETKQLGHENKRTKKKTTHFRHISSSAYSIASLTTFRRCDEDE